MGLEARLRLARLYLVTDARRQHGDLADFLAAVFAGGVDVVRIADRDLPEDELLAALQVARTAAQPRQGLVVVDRSPTLADRFRSDLLHVGPDDDAAGARAALHQWGQVGRSAHTADEARAALADPETNYLTLTPALGGDGRGSEGLDLVRTVAEFAPVADSKPWFAGGGVTPDNLDEVLAAGARRVLVSTALVAADDPHAVARDLKDRLRRAWRDDPAMEQYSLRAIRGS